MATFAKSLENKLKTLEASQTGIQTLSLWIIHHRHHAALITNAWVDRVKKVSHPERRLGLFYLANDVVQNGRRKAKDLVTAFGKAFYEVMSLFSDEKTKGQVERVFNIWVERSLYHTDLIAKLRQRLANKEIKNIVVEAKKTPTKQVLQKAAPVNLSPVKTSPAKTTPVKPTPVKPVPDSTTPPMDAAAVVEEKKNVAITPIARKIVPPDFKVANLLVSIKKTTSLDSEAHRKSKKLDNLKIDASSYDSVKHVKDRSSVGKFHKQFEESKIILDDYIHTLKRAEKDKRNLLNLLAGGEAFYSLAQDEAKVIVNAYNTFGNRLNSMKRKLDLKIKKMDHTPENETHTKQERSESVSSNEDKSKVPRNRTNSTGNSSLQDMDLDSDSGDEIPTSERYNPSTAPSHDESGPNLLQTSLDTTNNQSMQDSQLDLSTISNVANSFQQEQSIIQANVYNRVPLNQQSFFNPPAMNGMSTFLPGISMDTMASISAIQTLGGGGERTTSVTTAGSDKSLETPDGLTIVDDPFNSLASNTQYQNPNVDVTTGYGVKLVNSNVTTPVLDEGGRRNSQDGQGRGQQLAADKNPAVQNLIDSLFPVLSKSLQTIKEKTQAAEDKPSVNAAMAFALGEPTEGEEVLRKKQRFDNDPSAAISPVSLTNPKGLSEHQAELINIAAGLTQFDENFLPVTKEGMVSRSQSYEEERKEKGENDEEKKRDDKKSVNNGGRHRHRSHKEDGRHRRSSSRSPQRRSSHRSSKDSRDERRSERRRSSRHSPSPRRRKGSRRRSSSRERRHSPESGKGLYYNNRRSPTPEMDSSARQFPQAPVIPGGQIVNPMIPNQQFPQVPPPTSTDGIPNPVAMGHEQRDFDENKQPTFVNQQGIVMTPPPGMFPQQHSDLNTPNTEQEMGDNHSIENDRMLQQQQQPLQQQQQQQQQLQLQHNLNQIPNIVRLENHVRPGLATMNPLHINPGMLPGQMNFDPNIRPSTMGVQLRPTNPLHILQQGGGDEHKPMHLQPLGPRIMHLNPSQQFITVSQENLQQQPHLLSIDHRQISEENSTIGNQEPAATNLDPNDKLHQVADSNTEQQPQINNFPGQFNPLQQQPLPTLFSSNNPPPFPGAPPDPPPFPGAPPIPPPFMQPGGFQPVMNTDLFNPVRPGLDKVEMFNPRPGLEPEMFKLRPTFIQDNILPNDPVMEMHAGGNPPFNQLNFEPRHRDPRPRFRPRGFHGNSPRFRPRGGMGPRHFRPRYQRPML